MVVVFGGGGRGNVVVVFGGGGLAEETMWRWPSRYCCRRDYVALAEPLLLPKRLCGVGRAVTVAEETLWQWPSSIKLAPRE